MPFLARKGVSALDNQTWYTLVIDSPSGKVFELQSTELDDATLNTSTIAQWHDADECPLCHFSEHYTRDELNDWYETFSNGHTHVTTAGLPSFMPVRASVAVPDLDEVEAWYAQSIPSIAWKKRGSSGKGVANATSTCNTLTTTLGAYTAPDFKIEARRDVARAGRRVGGERS